MGDTALPRLADVMGNRPVTALSLVRFISILARTKSTRTSHILTAVEQLYPHDPQLVSFAKAAVAAGSLSNLSQIAGYQTLSTELIQVARPSSIVLRLDGARRIPLRTRIARSTASTVVGWVGEGLAKPVTSMAFDDISLDPKKLASIVIFSDELARLSAPAAEQLIRSDLVASINAGADAAFISNAAATSARPAGILNSTTPIASTGSTPAAISTDVASVISAMVAAGGPALDLVAIAHPATAAKIGLIFGGSGATFGIKLIASSAVAAGTLVIVDASEILIGDEGVELSLSSEASVMMDSAPVAGTTAYHSLWQLNLVGIRAERMINWSPVRTNAAAAGSVTGIT